MSKYIYLIEIKEKKTIAVFIVKKCHQESSIVSLRGWLILQLDSTSSKWIPRGKTKLTWRHCDTASCERPTWHVCRRTSSL